MSSMAEVIMDQKRLLEDHLYEPGYESEEEQIEVAAVKTQDEFLAKKQELLDKDGEMRFSSGILLSRKG